MSCEGQRISFAVLLIAAGAEVVVFINIYILFQFSINNKSWCDIVRVVRDDAPSLSLSSLFALVSTLILCRNNEEMLLIFYFLSFQGELYQITKNIIVCVDKFY